MVSSSQHLLQFRQLQINLKSVNPIHLRVNNHIYKNNRHLNSSQGTPTTKPSYRKYIKLSHALQSRESGIQ